jgi:hypothetical protein
MGLWSSRRPRGISSAGAAVVLGLLTACGGSTPTLLDESAKAGLHAQVDDVRAALGDRTRATAGLEKFRTEVRRLLARGELAAADAAVLLAHAEQIERQVRAESPLPTPTRKATAAPPQDQGEARPDDEGKPGKDEGKPGKGKGKGEKKGGGDG